MAADQALTRLIPAAHADRFAAAELRLAGRAPSFPLDDCSLPGPKPLLFLAKRCRELSGAGGVSADTASLAVSALPCLSGVLALVTTTEDADAACFAAALIRAGAATLHAALPSLLVCAHLLFRPAEAAKEQATAVSPAALARLITASAAAGHAGTAQALVCAVCSHLCDAATAPHALDLLCGLLAASPPVVSPAALSKLSLLSLLSPAPQPSAPLKRYCLALRSAGGASGPHETLRAALAPLQRRAASDDPRAVSLFSQVSALLGLSDAPADGPPEHPPLALPSPTPETESLPPGPIAFALRALLRSTEGEPRLADAHGRLMASVATLPMPQAALLAVSLALSPPSRHSALLGDLLDRCVALRRLSDAAADCLPCDVTSDDTSDAGWALLADSLLAAVLRDGSLSSVTPPTSERHSLGAWAPQARLLAAEARFLAQWYDRSPASGLPLARCQALLQAVRAQCAHPPPATTLQLSNALPALFWLLDSLRPAMAAGARVNAAVRVASRPPVSLQPTQFAAAVRAAPTLWPGLLPLTHGGAAAGVVAWAEAAAKRAGGGGSYARHLAAAQCAVAGIRLAESECGFGAGEGPGPAELVVLATETESGFMALWGCEPHACLLLAWTLSQLAAALDAAPPLSPAPPATPRLRRLLLQARAVSERASATATAEGRDAAVGALSASTASLGRVLDDLEADSAWAASQLNNDAQQSAGLATAKRRLAAGGGGGKRRRLAQGGAGLGDEGGDESDDASGDGLQDCYHLQTAPVAELLGGADEAGAALLAALRGGARSARAAAMHCAARLLCAGGEAAEGLRAALRAGGDCAEVRAMTALGGGRAAVERVWG